jgi:hypothetical protein
VFEVRGVTGGCCEVPGASALVAPAPVGEVVYGGPTETEVVMEEPPDDISWATMEKVGWNPSAKSRGGISMRELIDRWAMQSLNASDRAWYLSHMALARQKSE